MLALSKMAAAVQPSATLAAGTKAKQMRAEGVNVFDFSLGEPDFPTPEHICAAAVRAMQAGHTRYTYESVTAPLTASNHRILLSTTTNLALSREKIRPPNSFLAQSMVNVSLPLVLFCTTARVADEWH